MARLTSTIKQGIIDKKNTYPALANIKFAEEGGSIAGLFNLEADTFSQEVNILEQLWDAYQAAVQQIADAAVPVTDQWLREKVLEFQYSTTDPQYVQLINLVPMYSVVDETLRIISRVSVKTNGNGKVSVKVATSEPPVALSGPELTALNQYLEIIAGAGVKAVATSGDADRLAVMADIYYDGQFVSSIDTDVPAAINNYLATLPFNGVVKISDIELAIKAVRGVTDVVIHNVYARTSSDPFSTTTPMARSYATIAGYIIEEDTASETFADTITYTAE